MGIRVKSILSACVLAGTVTIDAGLARADYYDSFYDGTCWEDPNVWDVDDPNWTMLFSVSGYHYEDVYKGRLRVAGAVHPYFFQLLILVGVYDWLDDYETCYFDNSSAHYMLANVRTHDTNFDPNAGVGAAFVHYCYYSVSGYSLEWEVHSGRLAIVSRSGGTIWLGLKELYPQELGYPADLLDANSPSGLKDPQIPHWMLIQFDPMGTNHDANNPDNPNDPNCHWLRAAAWVGAKHDWDGTWNLQANCIGDMLGKMYMDAFGDLQPFDPNWHLDWFLCISGYNAVSVFSDRAGADLSYDDIESRWGVFTNVSRTLSVAVNNVGAGRITIDPDLLDDPNHDPNNLLELRRYTDGTQVVLEVTPNEGEVFMWWKIYDPNHPSDANYVVQDGNTVVSLTMDGDYQVVALFEDAPLVESTFVDGSDGWEIVDVQSPNYADVLATYSPTWRASGGVEGNAYIEFTDPTNKWIFFDAPAKFLGDKSAYVGGSLKFYLRCNYNNYVDDSVLVLIGDGKILVREIAIPLVNQWNYYSVDLVHSDFRYDTKTGAPVSSEDFESVLANLTAVRIPGEYGSGTVETTGLDNVSLSPVYQWEAMTSGTTVRLRGVHGSSPNDVFAVGYSGTILHYDGSAWSSMTSGTTLDLQGVWAVGPNDVFAVGNYGTILHYDGSVWSPNVPDPNNHLSALWGSGPNDVFAVGREQTSPYDEVILHYDGTAWSPMSASTTKTLYAVWGSGPNDVFAVGSTGTILHYDGAGWSSTSTGLIYAVRGVWGSGPNDVFAVDEGGRIWHYDGSSWSSMASGTTSPLVGVGGSCSKHVFAVGAGGLILHYDGTGWSAMTSGTTEELDAVSCVAGHAFAVGANGTILRRVPHVHNLVQDTWYTTVQAAIDSAVSGDEVVLDPGTFTGDGNRDIDFLGKAITVRGADPNDPDVVATTLIDCQGSGRGFYFHSGEDANSVVAGLTVTDGYANSYGGGVYCLGAAPTITNCTIRGCWAGIGGGLVCGDDTIIANTTIERNDATLGGGIACLGSATIISCRITGNQASGGWPFSAGGGICAVGGYGPTISDCTISGNDAATYGGGIQVFDSVESQLTLTNCILWENTASSGHEMDLGSSSMMTVSYSDVQGGPNEVGVGSGATLIWGDGNIDADPLFTDPSNEDYHLSSASPCINAGDPNGDYTGQTDIDGEPRVMLGRVDMGADEASVVTLYYELILSINDPSRGTVLVEPNAPMYSAGTEVTLTAEANEGKAFNFWRLYDPNYPGDDNHVVDDSNNPITITMDSDREIEAVFRCGTGIEQALPLLMVSGLLAVFVLARRRG